jgi:putative mRNA 3-end processing factor
MTAPEALFEFHGGLHLKDSVLWLDAPTPRQLCFISHANVSNALGHQKILTTEMTSELLNAMAAAHGRGRRVHEPQALVSPYGRTFSLGRLSLELFPSGFVLGSASLKVEHKGVSVVYAGMINPRINPLVERLEARPCEILVLPSIFGQRRFTFPPLEQASQALVRFVTDGLELGETPVIFCSPLGEAQLIAHLLLEAGVRCRAHRQIFAACRVYQDAGVVLGGKKLLVRRWSTLPGPGEAVLWPIRLRNSPSLERIKRQRTVFVSGLALDNKIKLQMRCDASFAISSHADFPGLLEYVRACEPKQVVLLQGFGTELRDDLEALGLEVSTLGPPQQMSLF